jgi:NAD(P)-dependent dehydrogenase (short-subunit alcohol dehydrogenase family)
MGLLDGRVVIVTGAGRGLGRQHCLELAFHGATVVVNDLDVALHGHESGAEASAADEVAAEVVSAGGVAVADGTSVTDFEAVEALIERTVARFGRLDAVVNNAGILRDRMITGMSEEDFDLVVAVHLKGTWNMTRHACTHWRNRVKGGEVVTGRIVNTSSGAGLFGNVGQSNYGPAKAAVASLTIIAAMEMDRYGVTANAISPLARTRMTEDLPLMQRPTDGWDPFDPAAASPVVAYLCSEESGWLSGAVLRIAGDAVQCLRSWDVDDSRIYRGVGGEPVDATKLGLGLRTILGAFPSGIPSQST